MYIRPLVSSWPQHPFEKQTLENYFGLQLVAQWSSKTTQHLHCMRACLRMCLFYELNVFNKLLNGLLCQSVIGYKRCVACKSSLSGLTLKLKKQATSSVEFYQFLNDFKKGGGYQFDISLCFLSVCPVIISKLLDFYYSFCNQKMITQWWSHIIFVIRVSAGDFTSKWIGTGPRFD